MAHEFGVTPDAIKVCLEKMKNKLNLTPEEIMKITALPTTRKCKLYAFVNYCSKISGFVELEDGENPIKNIVKPQRYGQYSRPAEQFCKVNVETGDILPLKGKTRGNIYSSFYNGIEWVDKNGIVSEKQKQKNLETLDKEYLQCMNYLRSEVKVKFLTQEINEYTGLIFSVNGKGLINMQLYSDRTNPLGTRLSDMFEDAFPTPKGGNLTLTDAQLEDYLKRALGQYRPYEPSQRGNRLEFSIPM